MVIQIFLSLASKSFSNWSCFRSQRKDLLYCTQVSWKTSLLSYISRLGLTTLFNKKRTYCLISQIIGSWCSCKISSSPTTWSLGTSTNWILICLLAIILRKLWCDSFICFFGYVDWWTLFWHFVVNYYPF